MVLNNVLQFIIPFLHAQLIIISTSMILNKLFKIIFK